METIPGGCMSTILVLIGAMVALLIRGRRGRGAS
jgi:hypothetical protein